MNVPRSPVVLLVKFGLLVFYLSLPGLLVLQCWKIVHLHQRKLEFHFRLYANPLLSLTKEKFLPVYLYKILVKNFESL